MNANSFAIVLRSILAMAIVVASHAVRADDVVNGGVQPATAQAPVADGGASPAATVHFTADPTKVGDRVVQRLGLQMAVTTKIIQSGQVANESSTQLRRQQQRTIDVLEVTDGRATKARASFEVCRRQLPDHPDPTKLTSQPIEGKSYLIIRNGDELTVTDAEGRMPPLEEYKLVAEALDGVGKPNPLTALLAGRDVPVGQPWLVPREIAQSLLGLGSPELAEVHRFELTLVRVAKPADGDGDAVAVFRAAIVMKPVTEEGLAIDLNGELAVEPSTCRLAAVDLAGPVHATTIERTRLGMFQHSVSGELRAAIRSQFGRAGQ
jgi:hypothetical protein